MAAGNTAVLTYPDIGQIFSDKHKVSSYHFIRNGFTESMPRHLTRLPGRCLSGVPAARAPGRSMTGPEHACYRRLSGGGGLLRWPST
jgi:hypothetical protein